MPIDYDISDFTEEQKQDWLDHSIVPGPVHSNFNVCDQSCYVATYEYIDIKNRDVRYVDIYVVETGSLGQSVLYREDAEWEGSYGSMPLRCFLETICVSDLHRGIINILWGKGELVWKKTEPQPAGAV
jgi:hypothetical protein